MIILNRKNLSPAMLEISTYFQQTRNMPSLKTLKLFVNNKKAMAIHRGNKKLKEKMEKLAVELDKMEIDENDMITIVEKTT